MSLLVAGGGRVKKSDLVGRFKDVIDCDDPAEKERNRELFKTLVNNVAFVREIDGVRYVVVKKSCQRFLEAAEAAGEEVQRTGEQQRPPPPPSGARMNTSAVSGAEPEEQVMESGENPTEVSPIQLALQRSKYSDVRVKRMLNFQLLKHEENCPREGGGNSTSKPYALPLRTPPGATRVEIGKLTGDMDDPPEGPTQDALGNRRRSPSVETCSSPQLRAPRSTRVPEEPKNSAAVVPLDQSEHDWLVKCAAGHWSQVYGLLLRDSQLADKRDFMSGFTALHWAAKCGNSDMLVKIIDLSKRGGGDVDVNAKTHGGYTPLHIAALHNQQYVLTMLVGEYGADTSIRDNCGKRAYHYLHGDASGAVREMLGEPKVQPAQSSGPNEREELDLFPDLTKGLHSISRLFQPHGTSYRKKHKQRPALCSLSDDPGEEPGDGFRQQVGSDALM